MFASQVDLAPNVGRRFSLHATACAPSYDAWQTTRPRTSRALAPSSPSFSNRSLPPSAKNSSRDMSTTCRRRSIVCSSQSTSRPETALPFRSLPSVVASADAHVRPGLRFSTGRCSRRARRRARSRPRRRRACARIHEVVKAADNATVPSAVRAVLTSERDGLTTRAVVEGVKILRPETEPAEVSSALHAMRRRGEVAREGFHKNFKYRLVSSLTGLGSGIVAPHAAANEGGSTH